MAGQEILIIGGGVIGLSIARELHRRGVRRITVVEKNQCGDEASGAAAGMLAPQAETSEAGPFFQFCSESRDLFPAFAAALLDETGIDVELDRSGTLCLAFSEADSRILRDRYEWQRNAGLTVEHLAAADVRRAEPFVSPDVREGLFFGGDWQVDNRKLCSALRRYCEINEVSILENTTIENLDVHGDKVTGAASGSQFLRADQTIIAAGAWTSQIALGRRRPVADIEPVRGQIIVLKTAKRSFERVIYGSGGYLVPRRDGRILVGATVENAGFDKSTSSEAAAALFKTACDISPSLVNLEISDHWAGLRPYCPDGLPVIGGIEDTKGVMFATGHYRNGILLAPLTAEIIADAVEGKRSGYMDAFGPERHSVQAVRTSGH